MVNAPFNSHCNAALSAAPVKRVWDTGDVGVQRKVFRVEQMFAERRAHAPVRAFRREPIEQIKTLSELGSRSVSGDELKRKLAVVQATIARNRQELAALIGASKERRMARAAGELGAAVAGMENATQKVLHQVEGIDECAKALTATLKDDYNRGLAQDIQDHTVQIYEACNFQDIAGQRIAKVIETLNLIEEQVSAMLARCDGGPTEPVAKTAGDGLINGPKLDGDTGHTSQQDIDTMFG
jgi:chemotaxis protein CheZ